MNEKVSVEICRRKLEVELEGFTAFEILDLAKQVEGRMREIERRTNLADSSKLAILAALELAAEQSRREDAYSTAKNMAERKVERLTLDLQAALEG